MDIATLFHTGFDFESYLHKLGDDGLKFTSRFEKMVLQEDLVTILAGLGNSLKILALSEPWCPDCVLHIPLLAKMADVSPHVQLMIFPRDQDERLSEHLALVGKKVIPAALFMDGDFHEIGRWYERPAVVQNLFRTAGEEELKEIKRKYLQGLYLPEAMAELRLLLEDWAGK
jgi:thiol-disulfide isomerase/thioredoxin